MHTVGLVVYPHFQSLALAVASVFEYANLLRGEATYEFSILSEHGGPIASSQGFSVHSEPLLKKATTRSSWAATDRKSHSGSQAEQSCSAFFFAWALYLAGELVTRSRLRICKFGRHRAPIGFPACPVTSVLQGGDRHPFTLVKTCKRRIAKVFGCHARPSVRGHVAARGRSSTHTISRRDTRR